MSFFNKPLELLEESDLQTLLDNQVSEGKTIDDKEALHGHSDSDRKEFLYDISSFANASGGHLIFGIKEDGGVPTNICGLNITDFVFPP
jgi:predicted HTH transcriptional regulator